MSIHDVEDLHGASSSSLLSDAKTNPSQEATALPVQEPPTVKPKPSSKPEESPRVPLDSYLSLGCIRVRLNDDQYAVNSREWKEEIDVWPHIEGGLKLGPALNALWNGQWMKIFRASVDDGSELWRLYLLPDVSLSLRHSACH